MNQHKRIVGIFYCIMGMDNFQFIKETSMGILCSTLWIILILVPVELLGFLMLSSKLSSGIAESEVTAGTGTALQSHSSLKPNPL